MKVSNEFIMRAILHKFYAEFKGNERLTLEKSLELSSQCVLEALLLREDSEAKSLH